MIITAKIQIEQDRDPALVRDRLTIYLDRFLREMSVDGVHLIRVEDQDDEPDTPEVQE